MTHLIQNLYHSSDIVLSGILNRSLMDYPSLLACRARGEGMSFEYETIDIPEDLDEHDVVVLKIVIPERHLRVGNRLENVFTIVEAAQFDADLLRLTTQLLKMYQQDKNIDAEWKAAMKTSIRALKQRLKSTH